MEIKAGTKMHALYTVLMEAERPHTAPELAALIRHPLNSTRQLITTDLIGRKGLPVQKGKGAHGLTTYWLDANYDPSALTPKQTAPRAGRSDLPDVFPMIDMVWEGIRAGFVRPFTTQDFREAIKHHAPEIWAVMTAKWGEGGKGSGKLYSPANPLFNYLNKRTAAGDLVKCGLVPSRPGWGAPTVMQFERADAKGPPPSEEDAIFIEGRPKLRTHLVRERASGLRDEFLAKLGSQLACEMCDTSGIRFPQELRPSLFEVHHNSEPLATGEEKETRLTDLALMCASCHRALHKLVALRGEWFTVHDARRHLGF